MANRAQTAGRSALKAEAAGGGVRALERGLHVLSCFDVGHPRWTLADLGEATGLHKATSRRIVKTLEALGYLELDETVGVYHLGKSVLPMTYLARAGDELVQATHPFIERLAALTGETVGLSVWTEYGIARLDYVFTTHAFKPDLMSGEIDTVYGAADSKIFLAFGPPARFARLHGFPGGARLTPADAASLDVELDSVRTRGVAYDVEERLAGVCSLAVPVRSGNDSDDIVACITVVAPPKRFGPQERERFADLTKECADSLSRQPDLPLAGLGTF
jgi:IclR family pca regulon transcriptional regulator